MGDKGVMAVADDLGEAMQCSDHPYRRNPGGICAFCLQEKLGKLVSSSNSTNPSFFPPLPLSSSSNSSSPSFRRDFGSDAAAGAGRNKIPFMPAAHKKKNNISSNGGGGVLVLKRSKSVAPKPAGEIGVGVGIAEDSPRRKKSFWSFFYLSSSASASAATATNHCSSGSIRRSTDVHLKINQQQQQEESATADDESVKNATEHEVESPGGGSQTSSSSFGRKVARSRSVGCGSRSFSGDFLERISTGLGDCTLRRVESHREHNKGGNGSSKMVIHRDHEHRIKDTVKCGGIFGGLGMISSSYWLAAAADAEDFGSTSSRMSSSARAASRSRSWGWALASPMRAFRPVSGSKSLAPANAVASINSSTGGRIGNGNPSSLSVGG